MLPGLRLHVGQRVCLLLDHHQPSVRPKPVCPCCLVGSCSVSKCKCKYRLLRTFHIAFFIVRFSQVSQLRTNENKSFEKLMGFPIELFECCVFLCYLGVDIIQSSWLIQFVQLCENLSCEIFGCQVSVLELCWVTRVEDSLQEIVHSHLVFDNLMFAF